MTIRLLPTLVALAALAACSPAANTTPAGNAPGAVATADKAVPAATPAAQPAADSALTPAQIADLPAQCQVFLATMQACITNVAVSNPPLAAELSSVRAEALTAFAHDPASANPAACAAQANAFTPIGRSVGCQANPAPDVG